MMKKSIVELKHFETPKDPGTYHRFLCLNGKNKGISYYIFAKRIVMGRSDTADIRVLDIKSSREHAEVTIVGKDFIITDLGSQNGVVVNDLKIKQRTLVDGDKVVIGQTFYRFNVIVVEKEKEVLTITGEEDGEEEEPKKDNKKVLILGVIAFLGIFMLLTSGEEESGGKRAKLGSKYKVSELGDPFTEALKQQKQKTRESQKKLQIYFQKGLREFREGNYFRAMSEFENARQWSPNDPLAEFYRRKTEEALNKAIEKLFVQARRDEEALKFQKTVVSYCGVIRLLNRFPEDERYKNAQESIKRMEEKLGLEEGEIQCIQKVD